MKPLVSIIIPCYNSESWLAETLDCALGQTWPNKEIIVVNDGSRDRSEEIARQYESRGVKVITQPNSGVAAARNRGIRESKGDYINFLDADDPIALDKIERQLAIIPEGEQRYMIGAQGAEFYSDPSSATFIPETLWADRDPVDWVTTAWETNQFVYTHAWLLPRAIVDAIGPWNENIILDEDGEYFSRAVLASEGVRFCWDAKAYYRRGLTACLSGGKSERAVKSRFQALELCMEHLLEVENSPRTRKACANRFQRFFYEVYPNFPELCARAERRVKELGDSDVKPVMGPLLKPFCHILGWRNAKKLQNIAYRVKPRN